MKIKVEKEKLVEIADALLTTTGCREICRLCSTLPYRQMIVLDDKKYGLACNSCCSGCCYIKDNGCSLSFRTFGCVFCLCKRLSKRLAEFSLLTWFEYIKDNARCAKGRSLYHKEGRKGSRVRFVWFDLNLYHSKIVASSPNIMADPTAFYKLWHA